MRKLNYIIPVLLCLIIHIETQAQVLGRSQIIGTLCNEWSLDSLEIIDTKDKFEPPLNIRHNYIVFKENMTFVASEAGQLIVGKWRLDSTRAKIINYDVEHSGVKSDLIFEIKELSDLKLILTSKQMSGGRVKLIYKSKSASN